MAIWMIYDESLNINHKGRQDKRIMTNGKNIVWMVSESDGEVNWGGGRGRLKVFQTTFVKVGFSTQHTLTTEERPTAFSNESL